MSATPIVKILITGASGGLGQALARQYAAPGRTLVLWGRDRVALAAVAADCRRGGADAVVRVLDLGDCTAALAALAEDDASRAIDLAIFAAGLGDIRAADEIVEDPERIVRLGLVNFVTPSAMAASLAARMATRGGGAIVLIGSAAAFHALPFAAAYAASKAGLARFADALRLAVKPHGVRVTLVSPGFIDTAAARRTPGPRPFLLQPPQAAARIADAARHGRAHLVTPWPFVLLRWVDRVLPRPLRDRLLLALTQPGA